MVLKIGFNELQADKIDEAVITLIQNVNGSIEKNSDKKYISVIPTNIREMTIAVRELAKFI